MTMKITNVATKLRKDNIKQSDIQIFAFKP